MFKYSYTNTVCLMVTRTLPRPILFSLLACFLLLSSCQREPIYNPNKKISKIYYKSSYDSSLLLSETWVWDKDLLKEIYIGESSGVMRFTYDKKRLTNIHYSTRESNMLYYFQYDKHNRQIISIDGYKSKWAWESSEKEVHIDLHYNSDGLISAYEEEHFEVYYNNKSNEKDKEATQTVLQLLCPELSFIKPLKHVSKSGASLCVYSASFEYKDSMLDAFKYTWVGSNDTTMGKILSYTDIVNPLYNSCNVQYIDPHSSITNKYTKYMPQHMSITYNNFNAEYPTITMDYQTTYSTLDNYPTIISLNIKAYTENYPDTNYSNTTMVLEYLP